MTANFKVVVITGASKGLGSELARQYAKPNMILALIARDEGALEQVKKDCERKGAEVLLGVVDVTDKNAVDFWFGSFVNQYNVDLLIVNAGITHALDKEQCYEESDSVQNLIDVNFMGAIHCINGVMRNMLERSSGHIAIVSSLAAFRGLPLTPGYCASKAALKAYSEALRSSLSSKNITVTMIYPGFFYSNISSQFPGNKPFIISSQQAAKIIFRGINKQHTNIIFPKVLYLGIRMLSLLPSRTGDFILKKLRF